MSPTHHYGFADIFEQYFSVCQSLENDLKILKTSCCCEAVQPCLFPATTAAFNCLFLYLLNVYFSLSCALSLTVYYINTEFPHCDWNKLKGLSYLIVIVGPSKHFPHPFLPSPSLTLILGSLWTALLGALFSQHTYKYVTTKITRCFKRTLLCWAQVRLRNFLSLVDVYYNPAEPCPGPTLQACQCTVGSDHTSK